MVRCMSDGERKSRILTPELQLLWEKGLEAGVPLERMEAIWGEAIDTTAVGLAHTLTKNGPQMLTEHAAQRGDFERRLLDRWRPALDLFEMVLVACTEAGSDLHDSLNAEGGPASDHPTKLHVLTLLHARACLVANEVFALLRTGFAVGALARWRTLHEIAVIAFLLGEQDEALANRFLLHRYVERWKEAQCYQENCVALGQQPFTDEQMDGFFGDYEAVVGQYEQGYKEDWGWSKPLFQSPKHKPNFDDMEKLAGLGHNKPYVKFSHHAIHSGASGALDILELHGGGNVMLAGPSNAGLSEPGHGTLIALHQVTVALLLDGPNEVLVDDLLALKGIAHLLGEAGATFGACHDQLMQEEDAKAKQAEKSGELNTNT